MWSEQMRHIPAWTREVPPSQLQVQYEDIKPHSKDIVIIHLRNALYIHKVLYKCNRKRERKLTPALPFRPVVLKLSSTGTLFFE